MKTSGKALLIIMCLFLTIGCAKSQVIEPETAYKETEESPESFPSDYKGSPDKGRMMSWRDTFDAGCHSFNKGEYEAAMKYFLLGTELVEGKKKRVSLVAAAVCALALNNSEKYLEIMEKLKLNKDEHHLKEPTTTNSAFEVLQEIKR